MGKESVEEAPAIIDIIWELFNDIELLKDDLHDIFGRESHDRMELLEERVRDFQELLEVQIDLNKAKSNE